MQTIKDVVTWLKSWFYDKTEVYSKSESYSKTEVDTALGNKLNKNLTTANKNLVTDGSGNVTLEDKYSHPTYTARTGNPTANQAPAFGGSVTVSQITSNTLGHVTGATNRTITIPSTEASTSTKGLMTTAQVTKLNGIETGANKTIVDTAWDSSSTNPLQNKVIYNALQIIEQSYTDLDNRIDDLEKIEIVKVVSTLPTASSSTMNHIYVIPETNNTGDNYNLFDAYITIADDGYYDWQRLDFDLNEVSIGWNAITGKPFSAIDTALNSASSNPLTNSAIVSALNGKANTVHSHDIATITSNGFMASSDKTKMDSSKTIKIITPTIRQQGTTLYLDITDASLSTGSLFVFDCTNVSLDQANSCTSAVLSINNTTYNLVGHRISIGTQIQITPPYLYNAKLLIVLSDSNVAYSLSLNYHTHSQYLTSSDLQGIIDSNINTTANHTNIGSSRGDALNEVLTDIDTALGNRITSIELVPKSSDATGAIKLYYGDEPT